MTREEHLRRERMSLRIRRLRRLLLVAAWLLERPGGPRDLERRAEIVARIRRETAE